MICISNMLNGLDIPRNHVNIIKQKKRFSIKNGKRFSIKNGLLRFLINLSQTVERGGGLWAVSRFEGPLPLWLPFGAAFAVLERVIGGSWGAYRLYPKSRARRAPASREVSVTLYLWFCGFDFGHSLWLPFVRVVLKGFLIVPVGTSYGSFLTWVWLFSDCVCGGRSLWALSKVEDLARASRFPSMIAICRSYGSFLTWG